MEWARQQTYSLTPQQDQNFVTADPENASQPQVGKISSDPEESGKFERQMWISAQLQNWFNQANAAMSHGLVVMNTFQLVMVCYLLLMGPIAAALYAWPETSADLFKRAFATWLDGLVVVTLWKFWWNIVLLIMIVRITDWGVTAGNYAAEEEMYAFTAYMGLLMFIPFSPFDFRPGHVASQVLSRIPTDVGNHPSARKQAPSALPAQDHTRG